MNIKMEAIEMEKICIISTKIQTARAAATGVDVNVLDRADSHWRRAYWSAYDAEYGGDKKPSKDWLCANADVYWTVISEIEEVADRAYWSAIMDSLTVALRERTNAIKRHTALNQYYQYNQMKKRNDNK